MRLNPRLVQAVASQGEQAIVSRIFLKSSMPNVDGREKGEVSYQVLRDLSEVSAISEQWNALLDGTLCNRAFSSAQWYLGSCGVEEEARPYVIVARRGATLVGILPLVLKGGRGVATFTGGESDYNDMLVAPDDTPAMTGLLEQALSALGGNRELILSGVRDDSHCLRAAQALKPASHVKMSYRKDVACPYINLPSSYNEYLRTKSRSFRAGLRQAQRFAGKQDICVRELDAESFVPNQLPEIFLSLHLTRFAEDSPLAAPPSQAFVREVFPSLFMEGRLRAFALFKAEKIAGIHLCMVGAKSLCLWNGGFKAEAEGCSPGKLLIGAGIERACALRLDEYDFLRGAESYKSRWANGERYIGQLNLSA